MRNRDGSGTCATMSPFILYGKRILLNLNSFFLQRRSGRPDGSYGWTGAWREYPDVSAHRSLEECLF